MIDGNAIGDVGVSSLRDRKSLVRRRDLYRGDHGESQREEDYFKARVHTRGFVWRQEEPDILSWL